MKKLFIGFLLGLCAALLIPTTFAMLVSQFSDISEGDWYYNAVTNLHEKTIITGYEDGTYKPAQNINRAEVAVMLDKAYKQLDKREDVNKLKAELVGLQAKLSAEIEFDGECYLAGEWYQEGEAVEYPDGYSGVYFTSNANECTCKSGSAIECPAIPTL